MNMPFTTSTIFLSRFYTLTLSASQTVVAGRKLRASHRIYTCPAAKRILLHTCHKGVPIVVINKEPANPYASVMCAGFQGSWAF